MRMHMAKRLTSLAAVCGLLGGCLRPQAGLWDGPSETALDAGRSATYAAATTADILPAAHGGSIHHLDIALGTVFAGSRGLEHKPEMPGYDDIMDRATALSVRYRRTLSGPVGWYAGTTVAFISDKATDPTTLPYWSTDDARMVTASVGLHFAKEVGAAAAYCRAGTGILFWPEVTGSGWYEMPGPILVGWDGPAYPKEAGILAEFGLGVSCEVGRGALFLDLGYTFGPAAEKTSPLKFDFATMAFGVSLAF